MQYISTRNPLHAVSAPEAIIEGIAPDGGLYIPKDPDYSAFDWKALLSLDFRTMAERIFSFYFGFYISRVIICYMPFYIIQFCNFRITFDITGVIRYYTMDFIAEIMIIRSFVFN